MKLQPALVATALAGTLAAALAAPPATAAAQHRPAVGGPPGQAGCLLDFGVPCYSPSQLQRAYDLDGMYARGLTGRGRTIVIVDPLGSPTIEADLATFDAGFGLPPPASLRVLQPLGPVPAFDPADQEMVDKAAETTADVEWAHALAPGAGIVLLETPVPETLAGGGFPAMMAAADYAVRHDLGDVISQSFSLPEQNFPGRASLLGLRYAYRAAARHQVTVIAGSNDFGVTGTSPEGTYYRQPVVYWPASDPLVTGVGGTALRLSPAGARLAPDAAWNDTSDAAVAGLFGGLPPMPWASGGGHSTIFARPRYQDPVRSVTGPHRGVPDVAMSASFSGSVLIFESFSGAPGAWLPTGGSSEAAPEFAGLIAIADQAARRRLGLINPALYRLAQRHAAGLTDVTQGNNTVSFPAGGGTATVPGYLAGEGYDLVTGVGTVDAGRLIPELAGS